MIFQKTIAVDFDGTITLNGDLAEGAIPPPRKNVARVMRKWIEDGFIVIINTLRYEDQWRIEDN